MIIFKLNPEAKYCMDRECACTVLDEIIWCGQVEIEGWVMVLSDSFD